MRASDLKDKTVVIWGFAREAKAAAPFIWRYLPGKELTFVDDAPDGPALFTCAEGTAPIVRGVEAIAATLDTADVIIKSPGVPYYHPLVERALQRGAIVTALLNLWFAEPRRCRTVGITGSKGKSTSTALTAHTLNTLGVTAMAAGNIGIPIAEIPFDGCDVAVIEVSSYQATIFDGTCDVGLMTAFYPAHLMWHGSLERYARDKVNLLQRCHAPIISAQAHAALTKLGIALPSSLKVSGIESGFHVREDSIWDGNNRLGAPANAHLARPHNLANICGVLSVIRALGHDPASALAAMDSYKGLPHRQQELGLRDGVLYVNDSISTTPQSAIVALEAYRGQTVALIAGGQDAGIDPAPLIDWIVAHDTPAALIGLGDYGMRLCDALRRKGFTRTRQATDMDSAVENARKAVGPEGVVLLSPAAPSFGMFRDFAERGELFARASGFGGV